jgi:hypothetical protein
MTRDPETIQKAIDTLQQAIDLELKKIETMRELRRALMIGKIAPGIFEPGVKAKISVEGGMTYSMMAGGEFPGPKSEFVVTQSEGDMEVRVPLYDVPLELWPEHMLKAFRIARRDKYKELVGEPNVQPAA